MSPLRIRVGRHSSTGPKHRNEDACNVQLPDGEALETKGIAAVLADGVSACGAGKAAAEACVNGFLSDYYSTPETWSVRHSATRVLAALNRWLLSQGEAHAKGMVATLSALVFKSNDVHMFHIGDSRVWRLRDGELEQMSRDHRALTGGRKNVLTRAMGIEFHIEIDYRCWTPEVGDLYVLTSDGVHDFLNPQAMLAALRQEDDLDTQARKLVEAALAAGGDDNASALLLRVQGLPAEDAGAHYRRLTELPFPPPLLAGQSLDGLKVIRPLHESKRTQVYLAEDVRDRRLVVLKTPSVNYDDDAEYIERFLHEEWVGRRINNDHVLKVLEPPPRRSALYYLTEYIEGQTLRAWMHDNPRPTPIEIRGLAEQIARGLYAFHRLEMVHQDLKPENVLIDQRGTLRLIDFGSTKIAGIEEIATPWRRSVLLGTEDYTAPEYIRGEPAGAGADQYALGVMVYELLTGRLPYDRALSPRNLNKVRYRPARDWNPEVPRWMDAAIAKAVALQPERRYAELSEFVHDLSQPNPALSREERAPLIQRNPLAFWRGMSALWFLLWLVTLILANA